jgi:lipopolysaccharide transport system permease protein
VLPPSAEGFDLTGTPPPVRTLVRDVWRSRSLLAILARKDFFVRYRRASFGMLWAVGLPVLQAVVLAAVFSKILAQRAEDYPVYVFSGIVPWSFFAATLSQGSTAVVDNSGLSNKIYFPRAILPLVSVVSSLYGMTISLGILVLMCIGFGVDLGPQVLLIVPGTVLVALLASAFALVNSALHVYFRDIRYLVQASLTVWIYLTPVIFKVEQLPSSLRPVIKLNPMTGMVELFRFATIGASPGWLGSLLITGIWTVVLVLVALQLHRRFDRVFADLL